MSDRSRSTLAVTALRSHTAKVVRVIRLPHTPPAGGRKEMRGMLEDVLLDVGTIVSADVEDNPVQVKIIGKRAINPRTGKPWDYVAVPFPHGTKDDSDFCYFNHYEIYTVLAMPPVLEAKEVEDA